VLEVDGFSSMNFLMSTTHAEVTFCLFILLFIVTISTDTRLLAVLHSAAAVAVGSCDLPPAGSP